jgi:pantetheine-phosphate adenylyltransferase
MAPRVALFAGTFDPVTFGHLDLVRRAAGLFDRLVVAVARAGKSTWFTADERVALIAPHLRLPGATVTAFDGLLVDFARAQGAKALLRGVRTFLDWENELRMMQMNRYLAPDLETVFLPPAVEHAFVASSLVREVAQMGADVSGLVPANVVEALRTRSTRERR